MGAVRKISIALTEEHSRVIKDALNSGRYATTSEMLRDALHAWREREDARRDTLEGLRTAWRSGVASGNFRAFDAAEIKREGRRKLAISAQV